MQLFAMVVFACITTEGFINTPNSPVTKCIFNHNDSACHYAVGIGVIAFLASVAFLMLDVYVPFMSNAQERKYAVMADLGFSGEPERRRALRAALINIFVLIMDQITFCHANSAALSGNEDFCLQVQLMVF